MKKIIVFLLLSVSILITGCDTYLEGHEIIGKWEHDGRIYEYLENGKVKCDGKEYDFFVSDGKITIDRDGNASTFDYTINSNGTMTMNDLIFYRCPD